MHEIKFGNMVISVADFERFLAEVRNVKSSAHRDCTQAAGPGFVTEQGILIPSHAMAWMAANGELSPNFRVKTTCGNDRCCNPDHLVASPVSEDNPTVRYKDEKYRRTNDGGRYFHVPVDAGDFMQSHLRKEAYVDLRDCHTDGCLYGASEVYQNRNGDSIGLCWVCHRKEQREPGRCIVRNRKLIKSAAEGGYNPNRPAPKDEETRMSENTSQVEEFRLPPVTGDGYDWLGDMNPGPRKISFRIGGRTIDEISRAI